MQWFTSTTAAAATATTTTTTTTAATITQSVLRQVQSLFQREFFTECHLVLLLSVCSILLFPKCRPVAAYVSFLLFPSLLSSVLCRLL
jgi:hypothetical protein